MSINLTVIGQFLAIWIPVMTALSVYLGIKKTSTPVIVGFLGFLLSLVPPLSLIYVAVLSLKPDISVRKQDDAEDVA